MNGQTRTQSYPGLFRSQAEEAFRRDATEAAQHGWHPTREDWNGQALVVTYAYGSPAPNQWAAPAGAQAVGAPPVATLSQPVNPAAVLVVGAGASAILGSFLPWAIVGNGFLSLDRTGIGGGDGWLTVFLGVVLVIRGLAALRGPMEGPWAGLLGANMRYGWLTVLVGGLLLAGVALYEFVDISRRSVAAVLDGSGVAIDVGLGLLLILAAGIVSALASLGLRRRRATAPTVPVAFAGPAPFQPARPAAPAAAPALAFEPAQPPSEGTSPLLVAGVGLVAVAIGGVAGMAMLGMGPFAGTRTVPVEDIRPYVTAAPQVVPGSWSRGDVISTLRSIGFAGDGSGEPWRGEYGHHSATVWSDGAAASRILVTLGFPDDEEGATDEAGAITAVLLGSYAPGATDFVSRQLQRIGDGKEGGSSVFDGVEVGVSAEFATDGWVLGLSFEPT